MAINKAMRAALSALSYSEIDIKKNYQLQRDPVKLTARHGKHAALYRIWEHPVSCGDHQVQVCIFAPPGGEARHRLLLFFHGGGWATGTIDTYDAVCTDMARLTGCTVASVDYRLAPEHRFPAAPEDCYAVARAVFSHAALLNAAPSEIVLIGDSAGGNLAAAVSLMARDRGEFLPARQILIYPATAADHSADSPFPSVRENGTGFLLTTQRVNDYMDLYRAGDADLENPYYAPLLAEDLSRQPDTLIITAEYCPLRDEGEAYGEKLRQAGNRVEIVRMPDALHGYFSLPAWFELVRHTYEVINAFLQDGQEGGSL